MNSRKTYTSDLKSRIVLEMLREELTVSQISSKYGVHQSVLNKWRNAVLEGLPGLFADPRKKNPVDIQKDNVIEDLYRQVGKLSLQLEWLKKNVASTLSLSEKRALIDWNDRLLPVRDQAGLLGLNRLSSG